MSEIIVNQEKYQDMHQSLVIAKRTIQLAEMEFAALTAAYDKLQREHDDLQRAYQRTIAARVVSA